MIVFARKFPFKCPRCGSADGGFEEPMQGGMRVVCQDCGASEEFSREKLEAMIAPTKALPETESK